jgi:serine/threonine-protein kinase
MAAGAVLWSLVGAGADRGGPPPAAKPPVTRLSVVMPADTAVGDLCFSADGRTLVYDTDPKGPTQEWGQLWVRHLDEFDARPLDGTRGADAPALSPDGRWVAFFAWDDRTFKRGKLRKISVDGGPAVTLLDRLAAFTPAIWLSDDELLLFDDATRTFARLGAGGGTPKPVATLETGEGEVGAIDMAILPGGEAGLLSWLALIDGHPVVQLRMLHFADGRMETVVEDGAHGRYVPTGHIVFSREDALLAVPFDVEALRVTGGIVPLMSGLQTSSGGWDSNAFAVSDAGHLAYMPGFIDYGGRRIMVTDRDGNLEALSRQDRPYGYGLAYSPDGRQLAVGLDDSDGVPQLWLLEVATGAQSLLSREGDVALGPVWSPDGSRLAWWQFRSGSESTLWWRPADRSEEASLLLEIEGTSLYAAAWSPDGAWLAYQREAGGAGRDEIWLLAVDGSGETHALLASPGADYSSFSFAPDGRWIAYGSNESGRDQVYVRAFADGAATGPRHLLSDGRGRRVVWSPRGDEIFYRAEDRYLSVPVRTEGGFSASTPEPAFVDADLGAAQGTPLAVSPDGQRFAFIRAGEGEDVKPQINVVLHWTEELARLAGAPAR